MAQSSAEKKDRFGRMFPPRVEKLKDTLRLMSNCTNKSNYEWNQDLVKRCYIEIAKAIEDSADLFEIDLAVTVDGTPVVEIDTTEPLE